MRRTLTEQVGFGNSDHGARRPRSPILVLEVIATTALALSTVFVATMLTLGVARAATEGPAIGLSSGTVQGAAIAAVVVVVLSGYIAIAWYRGEPAQR
jgi:hypothetical protein